MEHTAKNLNHSIIPIITLTIARLFLVLMVLAVIQNFLRLYHFLLFTRAERMSYYYFILYCLLFLLTSIVTANQLIDYHPIPFYLEVSVRLSFYFLIELIYAFEL